MSEQKKKPVTKKTKAKKKITKPKVKKACKKILETVEIQPLPGPSFTSNDSITVYQVIDVSDNPPEVQKPVIEKTIVHKVKNGFRNLLGRLRVLCNRGGEEEYSI